MINQMGCKIYQSPKITREKLQKVFKNYRNEITIKGLPKPLIENVEDFELVEKGVRFKFLSDYVMEIPYRKGETQKVLGTNEAEIGIMDPPDRNLYFIYSSSKIADQIEVKLSRALSTAENFVNKVFIEPIIIRNILNDDAIELKYGWWDDIDTFARKGALKGDILQSKFYNDFEQSGKPTFMIFVSRNAEKTIKITSQGIVTFYGQNITQQEIEDYIMRVISPRI